MKNNETIDLVTEKFKEAAIEYLTAKGHNKVGGVRIILHGNYQYPCDYIKINFTLSQPVEQSEPIKTLGDAVYVADAYANAVAALDTARKVAKAARNAVKAARAVCDTAMDAYNAAEDAYDISRIAFVAVRDAIEQGNVTNLTAECRAADPEAYDAFDPKHTPVSLNREFPLAEQKKLRNTKVENEKAAKVAYEKAAAAVAGSSNSALAVACAKADAAYVVYVAAKDDVAKFDDAYFAYDITLSHVEAVALAAADAVNKDDALEHTRKVRTDASLHFETHSQAHLVAVAKAANKAVRDAKDVLADAAVAARKVANAANKAVRDAKDALAAAIDEANAVCANADTAYAAYTADNDYAAYTAAKSDFIAATANAELVAAYAHKAAALDTDVNVAWDVATAAYVVYANAAKKAGIKNPESEF